MADIRPATTADVEAIRAVAVLAGERFRAASDPRIAERADDPPPDPDDVRAHVDAGLCWVAVEGEDVVGFVLVGVLDGAAHVEEVDVRPDREGRGIGSALLDAVAGHARAAGLGAVTLTTFADVPWNRPFYERRGFRLLADAERTAGLVARMQDEAAHGLDPALRVAMRRDV